MDIRDLKAAGEHAQNFGVKAIVYGPAGTGKTPILNSAPRPVLLATEAGLLSMRGSKIPTYEAYTSQRVDEFFKWFFNSTETKNFDTLGIDSGSQMADIYLNAALKGTSKAGNKKHGMAAYGEMATETMEHLRTLFYTRQKHVYLICKEQIADVEFQSLRRPYFPGQVLPVDVPHLYDFILRLAKTNVPGMVGEQLAFQCNGTMNIMSRNRTGNLNDFEEPHFGKLVAKAMEAPPLMMYT
jgi:GTPase SAR1 family protein